MASLDFAHTTTTHEDFPFPHEDSNNAAANSEEKRKDREGPLWFLLSRIPTLVPPMNKAPNPIKMLSLLNKQQWLFFSVCKYICQLHMQPKLMI